MTSLGALLGGPEPPPGGRVGQAKVQVGQGDDRDQGDVPSGAGRG